MQQVALFALGLLCCLNVIGQVDHVTLSATFGHPPKVIVTEDVFTPAALNENPGATVVFKDRDCVWKLGEDPFDRPAEPKARDEK